MYTSAFVLQRFFSSSSRSSVSFPTAANTPLGSSTSRCLLLKGRGDLQQTLLLLLLLLRLLLLVQMLLPLLVLLLPFETEVGSE